MIKHTPGPWQVRVDSNEDWVINNGVREIYILNTREDDDNAEQDAHLIASAPEMYKELKAHCNDCDGRRFADHYGDDYCGDCKTRAALAKAEGKE
jgi:uncharacterized Zn finger protein (UPF0148 family)